MANKYNQLVFLKGKEKALDALFLGKSDGAVSIPPAFGYLALGYNETTTDNGFEDPDADPNASSTVDKYGGFQEITDDENYSRVQLTSGGDVVYDTENNQVIKKYEAEILASNTQHAINQFAICDNGDKNNEDTVIYSAASFNTFQKTSDTSITFIIGFKI